MPQSLSRPGLAAKGVGADADLKTKTVARIEMLDILVFLDEDW